MGIKTVRQPPYSRDLAPCDFWLFPKLRGCCYETTEEMKEAVMKVIKKCLEIYLMILVLQIFFKIFSVFHILLFQLSGSV